MRDIEKYTNEYLNTDFEQTYQVKFRRKKVLEYIYKYKPARILEIGCGMQSIARFVNNFDKFTIIEPSCRFIDKAKKDMNNIKNIIFIQGFLEDKIKELKQEKYDFIIISGLLHEIDNPLEFMTKVRDLCTDQTLVHLNVPNEMSLHRLLAVESGIVQKTSDKSVRNIQLQQNSIFSIEKLEDIVKSVGTIKIFEKGSFFIKPFTHSQMEKCLDNNILDDAILEGLYNLVKYLPDFGSEIYINFKYIYNKEIEGI